MKNDLVRERALFRFRRYYMHWIRNGFDSERSSTEALFKVREEVISELNDDETFPNNAEREGIWSQVMEMLMSFKMILRDLPIDTAKLEEQISARKNQESIEESNLTSGVSSASAVLGPALLTVLEVLSKQEAKNDNSGH